MLGRHDEAILADKRAKELDPVGIIINTVAGRTLHYARRNDEAIEQLKKTIELDPRAPFAYVRLADVYVTKGKYQDAVGQYQMAIELGTASSEAKVRLAAAYAKMGDRKRGLDIMKQLQEADDYISPAHLAIFYSALGEPDQAFATLERAMPSALHRCRFLRLILRSTVCAQIRAFKICYDGWAWHNSEVSLRSDPRFKVMRQRLNLHE
jgi:tetratricopeptide (TPR) repeat protein